MKRYCLLAFAAADGLKALDEEPAFDKKAVFTVRWIFTWGIKVVGRT